MKDDYSSKSFSVKIFGASITLFIAEVFGVKRYLINNEIKIVILKRLNIEMDLQARKISFVQEFLRIQNEGIISGLEKFLKNHKSELFKKNLKPMELAQFYNEIDKALDDSKNDRVIKACDLKSKYS